MSDFRRITDYYTILYLLLYLFAGTNIGVCLSVTQVDQSKTVEVRIMQLSPQSSPIALVLWYKFSPDILTGSHWVGASNNGGVGKTSYFLALCQNTAVDGVTVKNASKGWFSELC